MKKEFARPAILSFILFTIIVISSLAPRDSFSDDYPIFALGDATSLIITINSGCSTLISGACVDLCSNTPFSAGHNCTTGAELAAHFDSIPGDVLPDSASVRDLGSSGTPWLLGYIDTGLFDDVRAQSGALQIQGNASPSGDVTVFQDQTSGTQYQLELYAPNSTSFSALLHDGTNARLEGSGDVSLHDSGAGDVVAFLNDDTTVQKVVSAYDPVSASQEHIDLGHDGTNGFLDVSAGDILLKDDATFSTGGDGTLGSTGELYFDDNRISITIGATPTPLPGLPLSLTDTDWVSGFPEAEKGLLDALNFLQANISGAATLQTAYNNGQTIDIAQNTGWLEFTLTDDPENDVNLFRILNTNAVDNFLQIEGDDPNEVLRLYYSGGAIGYATQNNLLGGFNWIGTQRADVLESFDMYLENVSDYTRLAIEDGDGGAFEVQVGATSETPNGYEVEITTGAGDSLRIGTGSSGNLTVISQNDTVIDSGDDTVITSGVGDVQIGTSTDAQNLSIWGFLKFQTGKTKGTGSFSSSTTATVANTSVLTGDHIYVVATSQPAGRWWITINSGVSFTINSTATETSTGFAWNIFR